MQKYFYKKSLAEKFLKKKFSGNISLIAPVVDTLAGLCQPCVQINRTQFPSFNINSFFSIIIIIIIGHSFLVLISTQFFQSSSLSLSDTVSYFQYQLSFPFINSIIIIIYHPIGHNSLVQIPTFLFINRFHRRHQRQNYAILVSQITFYESSLLVSLPIS